MLVDFVALAGFAVTSGMTGFSLNSVCVVASNSLLLMTIKLPLLSAILSVSISAMIKVR